MKIVERFDRMIGFSGEDANLVEFGRERIRSVRDIIFVYYLAVLVPFASIAASFPDRLPTQIVGGFLLLAVLLRFRHWVSPPVEGQSEDTNAATARFTGVMVVMLSCVQAYFYIDLVFEIDAAGPDAFVWLKVLGVGLLAALTQGAALSGIIYASRVAFACFAFPLVLLAAFRFPNGLLAVPIAGAVLTAISFYLAELSHKTRLKLFGAQVDADEALSQAEKTNFDLMEARRSAQYRAEFDGLTGVRNRYAFIRDVEAALLNGQGGMLAVIDLDRFKPINDLYGHFAGDLVLRFVARRLQRALPGSAIVGRLGGDEFGVFVGGTSNTQELGELASHCDRALMRLRRPMRMSGSLVTIGSSAGGRILYCPEIGVAQALQDADSALYVAKREGLDTIRVFDDAIRIDATRLNAIEAAMSKRGALEQFSLAYQPIVNLRNGKLSSFEALARWYHPTLGEISPSQFIPIAERTGTIRDITTALLCKALQFASRWDSDCRLSFNLSAAHICAEDAAGEIVSLVEQSGFPLHRLQLEITETAMMINFDAARRNIEELRQAGCRIVLDDFGAGFASLVYLREIRFDKVKIDGSLIQEARNSAGRDMLNGVIKMLSAMKLESVAEFIATEEDRDTALHLGANFGQGYFLGQPLPEAEVLALLERKKRKAAAAKMASLERRSGKERRFKWKVH